MKTITKLLSLVLLFGASALTAAEADPYVNTYNASCPCRGGACALEDQNLPAYHQNADQPGFFQRMRDQNQNPNNPPNDQQTIRSGWDDGRGPQITPTGEMRGPWGGPYNASYNQDQNAKEPGFFSRLTGSDERAVQNPELLRRVHQALMNNRNIDARAIQVTTDQGGTVTLIGIVRSDADKANAENTIKNINGVKSVDNQLKTQPVSNLPAR